MEYIEDIKDVKTKIINLIRNKP